MFRLYNIEDPDDRIEVDEEELRGLLGRGWAPSVTTVIETTPPFGLMTWRETEIAKAAHELVIEKGYLIEDAIKEARKELRLKGREATQVGIALHDDLEAYVKGDRDEPEFLCLQEFLGNFRHPDVGILTAERFVATMNGLPYGGEIDLILGDRIIDVKFQMKDTPLIHKEWSVQLAAYNHHAGKKICANAIFLGKDRQTVRYECLHIWSVKDLREAKEEFERRLRSFYWQYS